MWERYIRPVRTILQQIIKLGLSKLVQYVSTGFVLALIVSRIWATLKVPSWTALLPDRRLNWTRDDYPLLEHPGREIRLLNIFPATGGAEIEASVLTVSFLDLPVYEAVSYAWGDANRLRDITLNGKRFSITENLWKALKAIRMPDANRTIWVDAISIDQNNVQEKSQQVGLMSFIYDRATRVLVWLAESPHPDWVDDAWQAQWDNTWAAREAGKDWPATAFWLRALINQEYWKRCWIIQEIRQARNIHIYFGSHQNHGWMPWSVFVQLGELYLDREIVSPQLHRILALQKLRRSKYVYAYSFGELLESFHDCFSSIKLDRAFALLGIADDDPGRYFIPDYRRSGFQLYSDLLLFFEGSEFHRERRQIEIVHFAALVRAILARQPSFLTKKQRAAGFGVDPGSLSYQFCRKFSGTFSKQTIQSLEALLNLFSEQLYPNLEGVGFEEAIWLPQRPESNRDWCPFFETQQSRTVTVRGAFAGHVLKLGPTYGSYLADPNHVSRWIRSTMDSAYMNSTLLEQVVVLNKKLTTVLGETGNYKVRNFVRFSDQSIGSYQTARIFVGIDSESNLIMGLVPSGTPENARLVQFWNSDAVLVVTPEHCKNETLVSKALIGRAGIVQAGDEPACIDWHKPTRLEPFLSDSELSVHIAMSIDTLTRLSFDTVILPGTLEGVGYTTTISPHHWTFDY